MGGQFNQQVEVFMIKPIQTVYKGYKFRSRLEARYAVFFDALGLDWQYEPEGFDLGNGFYYLPDFKITCKDIESGIEIDKFWVEIKGGLKDGEEMNQKDRTKVMLFANAVDVPVLILGDIPPEGFEHAFFSIQKKQYSLVDGHILIGSYSLWGIFGTIYNLDSDCWRFIDIPNSIGEKLDFRIGMADAEKVIENTNSKFGRFKVSNFYFKCKRSLGNVIDAYAKARQARFEHGEKP